MSRNRPRSRTAGRSRSHTARAAAARCSESSAPMASRPSAADAAVHWAPSLRSSQKSSKASA